MTLHATLPVHGAVSVALGTIQWRVRCMALDLTAGDLASAVISCSRASDRYYMFPPRSRPVVSRLAARYIAPDRFLEPLP
ncbi:MAG: hypothetical protein ACREM1_00635 [Longimicrobiales bacterium]